VTTLKLERAPPRRAAAGRPVLVLQAPATLALLHGPTA
jgi:hypothetical protein